MHLQDAMYATLKIYGIACIFIYTVIAIVLLFSYFLKVLMEPDEKTAIKDTKGFNPFRGQIK